MCRSVPQARHFGRDLPQQQSQIRRNDGFRDEAAEGARGRERQFEEAAGEAGAGSGRNARANLKTIFNARREARGGRATRGPVMAVGMTGAPDCRRGPNDDTLSIATRAGHRAARSVAGVYQRTPEVRLSVALRPSAPRGRAFGDQSDLSALP